VVGGGNYERGGGGIFPLPWRVSQLAPAGSFSVLLRRRLPHARHPLGFFTSPAARLLLGFGRRTFGAKRRRIRGVQAPGAVSVLKP